MRSGVQVPHRPPINMNDKVVKICCKEFEEGLAAIHKACEHAALNGLATKLPMLVFCPWCGTKLEEVENELA